MIPLGKIRTLALLAAASAGLLGGHSLTYLSLAPSLAARANLLEASGHGYLDRTVVFAAAMAIIAGLFWLADGALNTRRAAPALGRTFFALGLVQVMGFTAQEILERLLVGASLGDLGTVLLLGLPLQLVVAGFAALLVTALRRAGEAIAAFLGRSGPTDASSSVPGTTPTLHLTSTLLAGGLRSRGPPALSS